MVISREQCAVAVRVDSEWSLVASSAPWLVYVMLSVDARF